MKIAIIGYSGSGKSTLAEKLANHYSIPKLHMDTLQFQPGWQDSDRDWMHNEMKTFLVKNKNWVIDGNYSWCCYEERMEQADQIIFLNFSAWNCLLREKVWQRDAPSNSIGNLSVGFSGMDVQKMLRKDTNT